MKLLNKLGWWLVRQTEHAKYDSGNATTSSNQMPTLNAASMLDSIKIIENSFVPPMKAIVVNSNNEVETIIDLLAAK